MAKLDLEEKVDLMDEFINYMSLWNEFLDYAAKKGYKREELEDENDWED